jgi:D-arabinose 1-dehydrogenase-like Zn-dependent alcohol dehydrogenase
VLTSDHREEDDGGTNAGECGDDLEEAAEHDASVGAGAADANLTFGQAAVVPVSGLIAHRGVVEVGRLQAGQKVLITGASAVASLCALVAAACIPPVRGVR